MPRTNLAGRFPLVTALSLSFLHLLALLPRTASGDERAVSSEEKEFFEIEVLPVLRDHCFRCHGGKGELKANFRITTREGLLRGGDRGAAVRTDEPARSLLLDMISYRDENHEMPPRGKLADKDIAILTRWIELGAPFPKEHEIRPSAEEARSEFDPTAVNARTKEFWAFQSVSRPEVPRVDELGAVAADWSRPIDAFIARRLLDVGLRPNEPASRPAWIRRVTYDLTGLPPSLEEVRAFVEDDSPEAFERVVDRLLASPRYGERWGRHWLDLVRYAESNGYERDSVKPEAWRYRDYVVRALNEDKPYDRFLREQLAGDELDDVTADSVTATGFHRLGLWDDEPVDRELARYDYLDGIAKTTGEVMLGLTIGCARCHDHKIDPIPAKDYYRFLSFFMNISPHGKGGTNLVPIATDAERRRFDERVRAKEENEARLYGEIYDIEQRFVAAAREKDPELLGAGGGVSDLVELKYRFYRDTWSELPAFDELRPETEGVVASRRIGLAPASRKEAIGLVFEGLLRIPADGDYTFFVTAKDGSRLVVAGDEIARRAGTGEHTYEARVALKTSVVPIRFEYFHREGDPKLEIAWSGPGFERRSLDDAGLDSSVLLSDARSSEPTWLYTEKAPEGEWTSHRYDARGWKKGRAGFGRRGTPGAVVRTEWTSSDIWLRREFEVRAAPPSITLWLHHDENAEVYLNGQLIAKRQGHVREYQEIKVEGDGRKLLREGTNAIAIHCRQTGGGQYIDAGLVAGEGSVAAGSFIADHGERLIDLPTRDRYFALKQELTRSREQKLVFTSAKAMAVGERGRRKTHVLLRGNPVLVSDEVSPGFPSVLSPPEPEIVDRGETSGRRRALAEWVTSPSNPLSARVAVNRLWQHHFGRGIVRSPSNFGRNGDRPTHPLLLDWLANELVRNEWRLKPLHRQVVLSSAYRMSSDVRDNGYGKDPGNDLFWRFDVRRLTAEEIRDSMLLVSGELNLRIGGASMYPQLPPEVLATSSTGAGKWGNSSPADRSRRSIYAFIRRSLQDPLLKTFDFADTDSSCAVRFSTILPSQALSLLNGRFVGERARALSNRLAREVPSGDAAALARRALELSLAREASEAEVTRATDFVSALRASGASADSARERLALLVLNLNEFVFVD